jgi:hypothetical protein
MMRANETVHRSGAPFRIEARRIVEHRFRCRCPSSAAVGDLFAFGTLCSESHVELSDCNEARDDA